MSAFARSAVLVLLFPLAALGATIKGVVNDPAGQPVAGATVTLDNAPALTTGADGAFAFEASAGRHVVRAAHAGFQSNALTVDTASSAVVEIGLRPVLAESIVVSGIRAEPETPVTKTTIDRPEIEADYHDQDIPLLLRDAPSINTYTESGIGGSGYSYITLRGVGPTRINFTLDGVPLADSEDMATYFADFPDLAHSLQSIQVQRGVGTSTVGSPSFGGSVNLQSIDLSQKSGVEAQVAGGSFGTRFATVGVQSGLLPGGFAAYARLSLNETNGFREHSGIHQHNLFVSAARQNEKSQLKFTGFIGHERQQQSWSAPDLETIQTNMRANPMSPNDWDNFGYDLAQLQYIRALSASTNMTASAYYQRGYGWYRLYDDEAAQTGLAQYGLDGMLVGSMVALSWNHGPLAANYGVHVNHFRRVHTRDLVGGPRDYWNYGTNSEANAFAKFTYTASRWLLYSDNQLRTKDFHYHGDVAIAPIRWTFFNPKLGARRELSTSSSLYTSIGMSTREPARNDLFQGEDNATIAHDLHAVRPERLVDVEAGYDYQTAKVKLHANLYAMEFRHEIAATGELSDIGLALRRNVDRSYRRGVELDATWQALPSLRFRTNANVSRNRIRTWTQFYDVYDAAGNWVGSKPLTFKNVNPLLTPRVIVNETVDWAPVSLFGVSVTGRYVAKSYLDNTNNSELAAPSFFVLEGNVSLSLGRWIATGAPRLNVQVNNVLNNKRVYPSGYSYLFMNRDNNGVDSISGVPYFYPQATRNVVVMLDVKM
jgi:iron complex outermembrane receptor protein